MKQKLSTFFLTLSFALTPLVSHAHCQMPCGIYHDNITFDEIDQYVEKMVKCMSVINNSKFRTVRERNEFIRWINLKEKCSDDTAVLITTYFLQQKIKPGEEDTPKRLALAHKMLFLLVAIKQNTDVSIVDEFAEVWEQFKLFFHVEGYECKIEMLKQKKKDLKASQLFEELENHKHTH